MIPTLRVPKREVEILAISYRENNSATTQLFAEKRKVTAVTAMVLPLRWPVVTLVRSGGAY